MTPQQTTDELFMKRALQLALLGRGAVEPNPVVGAVLVRRGTIIAEGWHAYFGGPHAEAHALSRAHRKGIETKGATLYVNLEPCCHEAKKTPPCLPLLLDAGIKRVVVAMKDPNTEVSGKSLRVLKKHSIEVTEGVLKDEALLANEKFVVSTTTHLPFVTVKVAMSLDGKIATRKGDSQWISSEESRGYVRKLRDEYDAILVGAGTVLSDNPTLAGKTRQPRRIVLDSTLKTPIAATVYRDANVLVVTTQRAPQHKRDLFEKHGIPLKVFPEKIRLASLLRVLEIERITSVIVEGGSEVFGSCFDERIVDRVYWFIAPKLIGGRDAKPAVSGEGIGIVKNAVTFVNEEVKRIGDDLLFTARIKRF